MKRFSAGIEGGATRYRSGVLAGRGLDSPSWFMYGVSPIKTSQVYGSGAWLEERFRAVADDPWGHDWRAYERNRYRFVMEVICQKVVGRESKPLAGVCLDVGCSTGHFSNALRDVFQKVVAVDISPSAVARARSNYPGMEFHSACLPRLGFHSGEFNVVTCLEVLYYLDRHVLDDALWELSRVLERNGCAVFSSYTGQPPYFSKRELQTEVAKAFQVEWCGEYGSRVYSAFAKVLFDYYERLGKLASLLCPANGQIPPNDLSAGLGRFSRWFVELIRILTRIPLFGRGIVLSIRWQAACIHGCLAWQAPVRLACAFSKLFRLRGTHAILLARKAD